MPGFYWHRSQIPPRFRVENRSLQRHSVDETKLDGHWRSFEPKTVVLFDAVI